MAIAAIFHIRIAKHPTVRSLGLKVPWQKYLLILYIASTVIMVRSNFRIAEYVQGNDGILLQTETYLYLFDSILVFSTIILFNMFHPSKIINQRVTKTTGSVEHYYGDAVDITPQC